MSATQQDYVASARSRYRAAEIRGHLAGCAVAWDGRQCSCPGRVAVQGRKRAELFARRQDTARGYLFDVDPDARAWMASREDAKS